MNEAQTTIYVRLVGREEQSATTAQAFSLGDDKYQILMYANYNLFGEVPWEYDPGSIVRCENVKWGKNGETILLAVEKIGDIERTKIYVRLLEEATQTATLVQAVPVGENKYKILMYGDYNPEEDEVWEFTPGDIVRCEDVEWRGPGKTIFLAVEKVG